MKLVWRTWGIRDVRVGGNISASRFFNVKSSDSRASNIVRPFGEHTLQTNVSNALTSRGSSPPINYEDDRAPSPRFRKQSMIRSSTSRERYAAAQVFFEIPTNVPPQTVPEKLCKPMRPWALCCPIACTRLYISFSVFCTNTSTKLELIESSKTIIRDEVHQKNKHICVRGSYMYFSECVFTKTVQDMKRN